MEIPGAIEPRLIVQAGDVDGEPFTVPAAVRPAHPTVARGFGRGEHINDANRASVFVRHHYRLLRLNDLKGIRQIGGTWYARQIALDLRIQLHPISLIL